jgi:hypothetical protein
MQTPIHFNRLRINWRWPAWVSGLLTGTRAPLQDKRAKSLIAPAPLSEPCTANQVGPNPLPSAVLALLNFLEWRRDGSMELAQIDQEIWHKMRDLAETRLGTAEYEEELVELEALLSARSAAWRDLAHTSELLTPMLAKQGIAVPCEETNAPP